MTATARGPAVRFVVVDWPNWLIPALVVLLIKLPGTTDGGLYNRSAKLLNTTLIELMAMANAATVGGKRV